MISGSDRVCSIRIHYDIQFVFECINIRFKKYEYKYDFTTIQSVFHQFSPQPLVCRPLEAALGVSLVWLLHYLDNLQECSVLAH